MFTNFTKIIKYNFKTFYFCYFPVAFAFVVDLHSSCNQGRGGMNFVMNLVMHIVG